MTTTWTTDGTLLKNSTGRRRRRPIVNGRGDSALRTQELDRYVVEVLLEEPQERVGQPVSRVRFLVADVQGRIYHLRPPSRRRTLLPPRHRRPAGHDIVAVIIVCRPRALVVKVAGAELTGEERGDAKTRRRACGDTEITVRVRTRRPR